MPDLVALSFTNEIICALTTYGSEHRHRGHSEIFALKKKKSKTNNFGIGALVARNSLEIMSMAVLAPCEDNAPIMFKKKTNRKPTTTVLRPF